MNVALAVAVVGLGKIGLTLAAQYASRGLSVIGCDINAALVDSVNSGHCPIDGEEGLEERLANALEAKRLTATTDTAAAVAPSDVVVVISPLRLPAAQPPDSPPPDAALPSLPPSRVGDLIPGSPPRTPPWVG